jgi:GTP cyclohydrolase FolE2
MQRNSRFTGLPFTVLSARRLQANGRQIVVAQLVRRLNQEAAPLEERTLIIAERAAPVSTARGEPLAVTHSQRSEGSEDAVEHFELLAAITSGPSTLLLLSRDQLSRTTYELLERTDTGWRTRWSRTLTC